MPVQKTSSRCYKYGSGGKEYCGKNAKAKAEKQGKAIKASQHKQKDGK